MGRRRRLGYRICRGSCLGRNQEAVDLHLWIEDDAFWRRGRVGWRGAEVGPEGGRLSRRHVLLVHSSSVADTGCDYIFRTITSIYLILADSDAIDTCTRTSSLHVNCTRTQCIPGERTRRSADAR